MSEMLGNQYFLGRNYSTALIEFEKCIIENPTDKAIRRKLIICYTQTNNLDKSLVTFYNLISEDIKFVMDADPLRDDCPCAELIKSIDSSSYTIYENKLVNGILWLFCDSKTSLEYFMEAKEIKPNNKFISQIINIIQNQIPDHLIKTE